MSFLIIVIPLFAQYDNDSRTDRSVQKANQRVVSPSKSSEDDQSFYRITETKWPKIQFWGVYSAMVVWVAFIFGLLSFLIGHYAGARLAKAKIWAAIIIATVVAVLSRAISVQLRTFLQTLLVHLVGDETAASIADLIVYVFWTLYIAGVAVYLYETFTVTAKEAYPPRG